MGLTDKLKKATASIQWGAKTMSGRHLDQATVRGEIKDVLQKVINYSYEKGGGTYEGAAKFYENWDNPIRSQVGRGYFEDLINVKRVVDDDKQWANWWSTGYLKMPYSIADQENARKEYGVKPDPNAYYWMGHPLNYFYGNAPYRVIDKAVGINDNNPVDYYKGYGEGPREWIGPRYQYKSLGPGQIRLGEPKVYDNRLWK